MPFLDQRRRIAEHWQKKLGFSNLPTLLLANLGGIVSGMVLGLLICKLL